MHAAAPSLSIFKPLYLSQILATVVGRFPPAGARKYLGQSLYIMHQKDIELSLAKPIAAPEGAWGMVGNYNLRSTSSFTILILVL